MGDLGSGGGGLVDWGSGFVCRGGVVAVPSLRLWWVHSGSLIRDISDEASLVVSVVGDDLNTAIGKVHTVGSVNLAIGVLVLSLLEGGAGVLVLDTVLVSVWLRGELLHGFVVGGGGVVGDRGRLVGRGRRGRSSRVSQGNSHKGGGGADLK
jgi:hypothetical protein